MGMLLAVSCSDGRKIAQYELESLLVWDEMAAANNRLYFEAKGGKIPYFAGNQ
jgi:hypothetical protein